MRFYRALLKTVKLYHLGIHVNRTLLQNWTRCARRTIKEMLSFYFKIRIFTTNCKALLQWLYLQQLIVQSLVIDYVWDPKISGTKLRETKAVIFFQFRYCIIFLLFLPLRGGFFALVCCVSQNCPLLPRWGESSQKPIFPMDRVPCWWSLM